jgi:hypothetical protein
MLNDGWLTAGSDDGTWAPLGTPVPAGTVTVRVTVTVWVTVWVVPPGTVTVWVTVTVPPVDGWLTGGVTEAGFDGVLFGLALPFFGFGIGGGCTTVVLVETSAWLKPPPGVVPVVVAADGDELPHPASATAHPTVAAAPAATRAARAM